MGWVTILRQRDIKQVFRRNAQNPVTVVAESDGADMPIRTSHLAIFALGLACCGSGAAQKTAAVGAENDDSGAAVRLEAHEGQTQFKLGDPVMLELVFTSRSPGYVVNTNTTPYLPVSDLVSVAPEEGWVRSHKSFRGQGQYGNAVAELGGDPVRVPVLLNRTITFQKAGHYEVTLKTERLGTSKTLGKPTTLETCDPCRTTNTIGIDIADRDASEEAALVVSLSREIEDTKGEKLVSVLSKDQKVALGRELEAQQRAAAGGDTDKKQMEALTRKINEILTTEVALTEKRQDAHRNAAVRLAYLGGDDAVRAKVRFIVDDEEKGDAYPVSPIMVDGLSSSRNKQLQLTLLEAAWRDPQHVPTSILQTALREAKELIHNGSVTDESLLWAGTAEERQAELEEYQGEINEIAATLPKRTEPNLSETMKFLKTRGVPNQFN
jgi:hypothetical protein